jgi:hypothetical protein
MYKCWDEFVDKRLLGDNKTLPFPFLVIKLVVSKGIEIEDTDNIASNFSVFGLAQWNRSTSHMKRRAPAHVQDVEMEDTTAEMAEGKPSIRLEDRIPLSHTKYELLQKGIVENTLETSQIWGYTLLSQKECKPKCRLSQVISLDKYEVDPQGMVDAK